MVEQIRIFIGTEPKQWLACEVLRYSILKRTKTPVEFVDMEHLKINLQIPTGTGFSIYRYAIPSLCKYEGKAIYLDADIVVLSDISDLVCQDMGNYGALARPVIPADLTKGYYTSVMLLDNAKLKNWKLEEWVPLFNKDPILFRMTMYGTPAGLSGKDMGPLGSEFNNLDEFSEKTKIIHYTDLSRQPWRFPGHPLRHIFLDELKAAILEGEIPKDAVEREIAYGHIYPTILEDAGF